MLKRIASYKDNGVDRDETMDIEKDVLVTDARKVDEDDSITEDKDQSLNEAKENETMIEEEKNNSCQEMIDVDEGNNNKGREEMECDQVQNKSSKSYADVTEKNVIKFDKELLDIPTEIDSNSNEIVVFDDVMVKICNVPLESWTIKGISALASRVGKPLVMDNVTDSMCRMGIGRVGFARVLVEVTTKSHYLLGLKVYKNGSKEEILLCSMEGVRAKGSRQNVNEEKRKEENLVKSKNNGMVDSEGFIAVQKKRNCGVSERVLKPDYKPNTQHTRFVNQKSNMNGKANVQYEFQPKNMVNNGAKETVMPVETVMNNTSGNQKLAGKNPHKKA
ncbi:zinc knuckle CX2CX4HX4C containing protein [Tanacetum coccineum]